MKIWKIIRKKRLDMRLFEPEHCGERYFEGGAKA